MSDQAVQGNVGGPDDAAPHGESYEELKRRFEGLRRFRSAEHQAALDELAALKSGGGAKPTSTPVVSDDELADLGETERKVVENLQSRLSAQEETMAAQAKRDFDAFLNRMDKIVPNWRALNMNAAFLNWLAQFDSDIGRTRKQLFNAYVEDRDAEGAAAFFTDYTKQLDSAAQAPVSTEPGSTPADPAAAGMEEVWSPQEVADHYRELDDLSRDRLFRKGHPRYDELMERDSKIRRARAENRIR